ncbi:MAG: MFS transporter [Clostridiales bacterium]|nr:MFS transporter [Clostridiales bacterium]
MSTLNDEQRALNLLGRIERLPYSRWSVKFRIWVGTATFFDALDALMIAYIMPVLIPLWHISPAAIGPLLSISYVGQLIGAVVFGFVSEKIGRKKTLIVCILIMGVMSLVCTFATGYTFLLIARFIQGFGLGGEVPIAGTYVSEWTKAKGRGPFVVLYESVFIIGLVGTAALAAFLIPVAGWQIMFIIGFVPAVIVPIMLRKYPESPRFLITKGRLDEAEAAIVHVEEITRDVYKKELPDPVPVEAANLTKKTRFSELFSKMYIRRTIAVWLLWFCFYFINYSIQTWLPTLYTSQFGVPYQESLFRSMAVNVISFAATILVGLFIDKIGRRPAFMICFSGVIVITLLLFITGVGSANTLFIYTCLYGLFTPIAALLVLYSPELYPTRMRALGNSTATAWQRLASAIGPTIVGILVAQYSMGIMFGVLGIFAVIGLVVTIFVAIETKNRVLEEVSP